MTVRLGAAQCASVSAIEHGMTAEVPVMWVSQNAGYGSWPSSSPPQPRGHIAYAVQSSMVEVGHAVPLKGSKALPEGPPTALRFWFDRVRMGTFPRMPDSGGPVNDAQKRREIDVVVDSLEAGVGRGVLDHDKLEAVVAADFGRYASARIKDFVPVLVERNVRDRLLRARAS